MTTNSFYLQQQELLYHAKNPLNYGILSSLDFVSEEHNPSCGDSVIVGGIIKDKILVQMRFEGSGCVLSMAMASKLTQVVVGMSLQEIEALDDTIVERVLGMPLGVNRIKCGLLSVLALQKGIKIYQDKC